MIKTTFRYFMPRICVCVVFFFFFFTFDVLRSINFFQFWPQNGNTLRLRFLELTCYGFVTSNVKLFALALGNAFRITFSRPAEWKTSETREKMLKVRLSVDVQRATHNRVTDSRQQRAT